MATREDTNAGAGGQGDLLLGRGIQFDGKLRFEGTVRIDAHFTGSITTSDVLVVGEAATIEAQIDCGAVVVHGQVLGNIKARDGVELREHARVRGSIETPSLVVERGALFEGDSRMTDLHAGIGRTPVPGPRPGAHLDRHAAQ
ncbi:MAG TPA: polymer-forming cytoskeletal protein [Anaeromyxobacteraceae bacterium]|nr:polymer-forming cytoskeletal protein [Anaeromyxobacteraceae bacterium]